ncbi:MAG: hypothetical protein HUK23_07290 [Sphaerochaetaceae bacterium]|nr:hypothetical protein [Sphaerochaetaceae bacterium]
MKVKFLFALLLLTISNLWAGYYKSNLLAQKLKNVPSLGEDGYYLYVNDNEQILYLDGISLKKITTDTIGNYTYVYEEGSNYTSKKTYKDNRLIQEELTNLNCCTLYNYTYYEGHLSFVSVQVTNKDIDNVFFLRSASDGQIVAIKHDNEISLIADNYLTYSNQLLTQLEAGQIVEGNYVKDNDGNLVIERDGLVYKYSSLGKLLYEQVLGGEIEYYYDDNLLIKIISTVDAQQRITYFVNEQPSEQHLYENEILKSITHFYEGGNIQEIYSDDRLIAVVYYRKDNYTVDRIEYK